LQNGSLHPTKETALKGFRGNSVCARARMYTYMYYVHTTFLFENMNGKDH